MMNLLIALRLLLTGEFDSHTFVLNNQSAILMKNVGCEDEAWYWLNPEKVNLWTVAQAVKALR